MKCLIVTSVVLVAGCATAHPPVRLIGAPTDIAALTGEWSGDYSSSVSGRAGSISFVLRAAGDSAFGDVIMIPSGWTQPLTRWREPTVPVGREVRPEVLTIKFVRIEKGSVSGSLDPYGDPRTGVRLFTTFVGQLNGNVIEGTYTTFLPSGEQQTGRWTVERAGIMF